MRDRVQRGVDRRKSRKKDVQRRRKRLHAQDLMEICFLGAISMDSALNDGASRKGKKNKTAKFNLCSHQTRSMEPVFILCQLLFK